MVFKREPSILVATHGTLGEALIQTASMILGNLENLQALSLVPGDDPEVYLSKMAHFVETNEGNAIVLVDVVGGTPYNAVMKLSRDHELCAVAGVNLPMLIEAIETRSNEKDQTRLSKTISDNGKSGVQDMTPNLIRFFQSAKNS